MRERSQLKNIFKPKVSIIIPVFNGENYLNESIDSAISQTYDNLEVIVVNDGSTDNGMTEEIIKAYGDKVKYYYKQNGGVSSALNYGISRMNGEYFSWLSHDDKYSPTKVEDSIKLLARLENRERAMTIAFTGGCYINSKSEYIKSFPESFDANKRYDGNDVIIKMLKKNTLNGCCMLIPKTAFEQCGGFDESLRYNQDALMWYLIFTHGYGLITDNNNNVMYRLHRKQTSKLRRDLYLHDTVKSSNILIPLFGSMKKGDENVLYLYARRIAINNCVKAVNMCIKYGKQNKLLNLYDILKIRGYVVYGCFRNILKYIRNKLIE